MGHGKSLEPQGRPQGSGPRSQADLKRIRTRTSFLKRSDHPITRVLLVLLVASLVDCGWIDYQPRVHVATGGARVPRYYARVELVRVN